MNWWVGSDLVFPFDTMILMVFYFLLPRITTMTYTFREAAGLWWEDRFRPLVATVVNLTFNIILVQWIGMNGVIISTLLCTIFINVPWGSAILFKNYFKRSFGEYIKQILFYIFVTIIVGVLTMLICDLLPSEGPGVMFMKAGICLFVPNLLFALFYHRMKEYKFTQQLVSKIIYTTSKTIGGKEDV